MTNHVTAAALLCAATEQLAAAGIASNDARHEARLLLAHALGVPREELVLRPDRPISPDAAARVQQRIARRVAREPLAYLTGTRSFYGLDFVVSPDVLIPRPETEFVVEAALRQLAGKYCPRFADVGTGSGCIAVAVAVHAPHARVWASDVSPEALAIAKQNAARNGVADRVTLLFGDLLAPLAPFAPFDAIASNPPYIAPAMIETLEPEVRDWEPRVALGIHDDALHFYRRLAQEAPPLLAPGGVLIVEVGQSQADIVAALWRAAGLKDIAIQSDYAGIPCVVQGALCKGVL